jgi:murein L,D-transpeptidase YcbB/YkuD
MEQFLKSLEPESPRYISVKRAYAFYESLATQGKYKPYPHSLTIRLGDEGKPVRDLQERLKQEDLYHGTITGRFDAATQEAVKEFQIRHMLAADGALGAQTRTWLNVSYEEKSRMLAHSVKVLRQSRTRGHDRFLRINTPQFVLEYFKNGKLEASHRVIVGKAAGKKIKLNGQLMGENHTPSLASSIDHLVFNPRWYVSDRIRKELDDVIQSDPNFFAKNGYVKMASLYPWGEPRIYQLPGPKNPLGRVMFRFDNPYAVFIHDTPNKSLFQRSRRDLSHGCIRLDRALDLAKEILEDDNNAAIAKVDSLLSRNTQSYVGLNTPIPIIIEYAPVSTDENGRVIFCGDPYGRLKDKS